jgi:hypothetical protein
VGYSAPSYTFWWNAHIMTKNILHYIFMVCCATFLEMITIACLIFWNSLAVSGLSSIFHWQNSVYL